MKELKCKNCNSVDLIFDKGVYVCQNCGTKYLPDTKDFKKRLKKTHDRMLEAINDYDFREAQKLSETILSIYETDAYAYLVKASCIIAYGMTQENVHEVIEATERALQYAQVDEIDDIKEYIRTQIGKYWKKMIDLDNALEERVNELSKV